MHTVLTSECTGCELCVQPCPVDCIDMIVIEPSGINHTDYYRMRYQQRNQRLAKQAIEKYRAPETTTDSKKALIQAALARKKDG